MHGVSDLYIKRAFEIFGFASYVPVKEQQEPNPDFPTVKFPNPEEKGALVNFLPCVFSFLPPLKLEVTFSRTSRLPQQNGRTSTMCSVKTLILTDSLAQSASTLFNL